MGWKKIGAAHFEKLGFCWDPSKFFQKHSFTVEINLCKVLIYGFLPPPPRITEKNRKKEFAHMVPKITETDPKCFYMNFYNILSMVYLIFADFWFFRFLCTRAQTCTSFEIIMGSGKISKILQFGWFWNRNKKNSYIKNRFSIFSMQWNIFLMILRLLVATFFHRKVVLYENNIFSILGHTNLQMRFRNLYLQKRIPDPSPATKIVKIKKSFEKSQ